MVALSPRDFLVTRVFSRAAAAAQRVTVDEPYAIAPFHRQTVIKLASGYLNAKGRSLEFVSLAPVTQPPSTSDLQNPSQMLI